MMRKLRRGFLTVCAAGVMALTGAAGSLCSARAQEEGIPALRDVLTERFGEEFCVGTAIVNSELGDKRLMNVVTTHFNAVTTGNELKPDAMFGYSNQVCPGTETVELNGEELVVPKMDYSRAEKTLNAILKWNEENPNRKIRMRGHVLVWHSQTPEWFFHEDYDAKKPYVSPEEMDRRQEWYIKTMAEHFTGEDSPYHGLFYGWDVVNEAISDSSGTYRKDTENSSWWAVYQNQDFIISAFRYANQYMDPEVQLYYNDYNEWFPNKRKGILQLIADVKAAEGTRIDGMGMQGHYSTAAEPSVNDFADAARAYGEVVNSVQITELDLKASDAYDGSEEKKDTEYELQARRYLELFETVCELKEEGVPITGITFWGVIDPNSWLQTFHSVGGAADGRKRQVPLLFDGNYQAKPAFWAFADSSRIQRMKKRLEFTQAGEGGSMAGCPEYTISCGDAEVTYKACWNQKGLILKATVKDKSKDKDDKVCLYASVDGGETILSCEKGREQGIVDPNGYDVVLMLPLEESLLQAGTGFLVDFTVTNGDKTVAFSDRELRQKETAEDYAEGILVENPES